MGRTSQLSVTSAFSQAGMNPQCKHCGKFVKIPALLTLHQSRCLSNSKIGVVTDQILNCTEGLETTRKLFTPRSGRSVSCNQPTENLWFRRLRSLSDVRNEQKLNKLSQITQQSVKSSEDILAEICLTQQELRGSTYEDNFSNSGQISPTPSFRERQPK